MKTRVFICIAALLALALFVAGCVDDTPVLPPDARGEVGIMYTAAGQMPILLQTGQIDGYIIWQPFVSIAEKGGFGTIVSYSQDIPPENTWTDHTCCALSARQDFMKANPDIVNAISAIIILSGEYIRENPDRAADITAYWLFGGGDMTYGDVTINSKDLLKDVIPTIRYTTEPSEAWLNSNLRFVLALREIDYLTGILEDIPPEEVKAELFDFSHYEAARAMIDTGEITTPAKLTKHMSLGYLPSAHNTPLFVAIKEWEYFDEEYGIALKPRRDIPGKVDVADLIINGVAVAEVRLVEGEGGAQLMTLMAGDAIQMAYAGTPPTISSIDRGTPIKILHPTQTEGSGFVVAQDAPVTDWDSFIEWVELRTAEGRPVKIAAPIRGSIQDVQIKFALQDSGVVVKEVR